MAKKKFDISSTLNKNKPSSLAGKVPLKKIAKDPDTIKSKVEEIHGEKEQPASPPQIEETKPKPKPKPKVEEARLVRMTIDTPEDVHKRLKIKAVEHGVSIRKYILRLIEKDLKSGRK